jgi:hypothetical protein
MALPLLAVSVPVGIPADLIADHCEPEECAADGFGPHAQPLLELRGHVLKRHRSGIRVLLKVG